jgi:SanA protein
MGKIKKILVSGEKSKGYDETEAMKNYLIFQKECQKILSCRTPEGFNTRRSINNCKNSFKKSNVIIVSQGFHNLRAFFMPGIYR